MLVESLIVTKGADIICNIIADLAKDLLVCKFSKKNDDGNVLKVVKEAINDKDLSRYNNIFESSVFIDFINLPQSYDYLCGIIELHIIYQTNVIFKRKSHQKVQITDINEMYDYLIINLQNEYRAKTVVEIPKKEVLKECLDLICKIVRNSVMDSLDIRDKMNMFNTNYHLLAFEHEILNSADKIIEFLKNLNQYPIKAENKDYLAVVERYHNILKYKNSTAHIYLLDTFDFTSFYVPPFLEIEIPTEKDHGQILEVKALHVGRLRKRRDVDNFSYNIFDDWKYIFDNQNIIYVTGGAGYGKSLFMKKIINDYQKINLLHSNEYLIIYGEIKMFYANGKDFPMSMLEFLQLSMKNSTLMDESELTIELIQDYLDKGRCILLLDALDEVDKIRRNDIHEKIISFLNQQNPNNKICITSRSRGFFPDKKIRNFNIMSLNEIQISTYVDNIIKLGKFEEEDKISFMNQAKLLVDKGFLNSFLVLSLLINIFKAERELPENKLELYQKCFEYIATKREREKASSKYKWDDIGLLMKDNTFIELANLCYPNNTNIDKSLIKNKLISIYTPKFGNEANAENAIEEFLSFCSDRTELFVPSTEDHFKFFHRSFFEYFYSQFIFTRCQTVDEIYEKLIHFDVDSEVYELTVALLKQKSEGKYQELVERLFTLIDEEFSMTSITLSSFNILTLCMQVIDDRLYRDKYFGILLKYKDFLSLNSWNINNELIQEFLLSNNEYYLKINDTFYYENMLFLITTFKKTYRMYKDLKKEGYTTEMPFPYISRSNSNFHIKVFLKTNDIGKILKNICESEVNQVRIRTNADSKQWYGVKKSLGEYKNLKSKDRKRINDFILMHGK